MYRTPFRRYRAWAYPGALRPEAVPDTRPTVVAVATLLFTLNLVVSIAMVTAGGMSGGKGLPLPLILIAGGASLIMAALVAGVWTGRELPRWLLMRIGIGLGAMVLIGALINFSVAGAASVWMIATMNLTSGALMLSGGLLMMVPGVKAWCGGRRI